MTPGSGRWGLASPGALLLALFLAAAPAGAATFVLVNQDGPTEGFNDPGRRVPVGGNPGTTLGAQRLAAFQQAADLWGARLDSSVTIRVQAAMDSLTCSPFSAVLGGAGAIAVIRDFSGAPRPGTWYHVALASALTGVDLAPGGDDIGATFNKDVDDDPGCLTGVTWYYGYDDAPSGTISFVRVVLHELGHGLGVSTFVDPATGQRLQGFDDVYMTFLEDHSVGSTWPELTNSGRRDSAKDTGDLHWIGPEVRFASGSLASGKVGDHVRMYAPNPVQAGSSVSHWDTSLKSASGEDELMEPVATPTMAILITDELFADEGWTLPPSCPSEDVILLESQLVTTTVSYQACTRITAGNGFVVGAGGDVTFTAGRSVELGGGFEVDSGGAFRAVIDPTLAP